MDRQELPGMRNAVASCVHSHPGLQFRRDYGGHGCTSSVASYCEVSSTRTRSALSRRWVTPHVELVEQLAEGAMGVLWRGYHHMLASDVAIKIMLREYRDDRVMLDRFHMEAVAAARVKHPNVVQVYDHGFTSDGTGYIVMELLEGPTLRQMLEREGR